jgi:hypothetical protein
MTSIIHLPPTLALAGAKLYQFVQRYLMTKEQLLENGYPHAHPDVKGKAVCKLVSPPRCFSSKRIREQIMKRTNLMIL